MHGQQLLASVAAGRAGGARGRTGVGRLAPGKGSKHDRYRGEQEEPRPHIVGR